MFEVVLLYKNLVGATWEQGKTPLVYEDPKFLIEGKSYRRDNSVIFLERTN